MPEPISFKDFRRYFERHGVTFESRKGGGSHNYMMSRMVGGKMSKSPIPLINGRQILNIYIAGARKKLKLTEADGVPDSDFFA